MSGIEVIGLIASATQLIRYTGDIIDYTQSIFIFLKGSTRRFGQHREHLEALISAVEVIRQTPSLQTQLIRHLVEVLLRRTENIRAVLRRYTIDFSQKLLKRFRTALSAHKAQEQILEDLCALRRDKSSLLLGITSSYGVTLEEIKRKTNSELMAPKIDAGSGWDSRPSSSRIL